VQGWKVLAFSSLYPQTHSYFDPSFFAAVFDITGGHVGVMCDFLATIAADNIDRPFLGRDI
jgi:hypothetical protein